MSRKRAAPISGIAFVVCFIASVAVSSVPKDTASDSSWVGAYSTHAKQAGHFATGVLLILAGLCLMSFLTHLWTRVRAAYESAEVSPLPIIAGGVSAACIAVGGVLMAAASGSALLYSQPIPGADVLRLTNDAGFAMVGVAGMLAAALSVATVSTQARAAGLFGTSLWRFSLAVAVVLLASIAFAPILALVVWLLIVTLALKRIGARGEPTPALSNPADGERSTLAARA
jgi:hypothetical protein